MQVHFESRRWALHLDFISVMALNINWMRYQYMMWEFNSTHHTITPRSTSNISLFNLVMVFWLCFPDIWLGSICGLLSPVSVSLPVCLWVCLSACLPVNIRSPCLFVFLLTGLCTCLSACLPVCLLVRLLVCLWEGFSVCLSVCLLAGVSSLLPVSLACLCLSAPLPGCPSIFFLRVFCVHLLGILRKILL